MPRKKESEFPLPPPSLIDRYRVFEDDEEKPKEFHPQAELLAEVWRGDSTGRRSYQAAITKWLNNKEHGLKSLDVIEPKDLMGIAQNEHDVAAFREVCRRAEKKGIISKEKLAPFISAGAMRNKERAAAKSRLLPPLIDRDRVFEQGENKPKEFHPEAALLAEVWRGDETVNHDYQAAITKLLNSEKHGFTSLTKIEPKALMEIAQSNHEIIPYMFICKRAKQNDFITQPQLTAFLEAGKKRKKEIWQAAARKNPLPSLIDPDRIFKEGDDKPEEFHPQAQLLAVAWNRDSTRRHTDQAAIRTLLNNEAHRLASLKEIQPKDLMGVAMTHADVTAFNRVCELAKERDSITKEQLDAFIEAGKRRMSAIKQERKSAANIGVSAPSVSDNDRDQIDSAASGGDTPPQTMGSLGLSTLNLASYAPLTGRDEVLGDLRNIFDKSTDEVQRSLRLRLQLASVEGQKHIADIITSSIRPANRQEDSMSRNKLTRDEIDELCSECKSKDIRDHISTILGEALSKYDFSNNEAMDWQLHAETADADDIDEHLSPLPVSDFNNRFPLRRVDDPTLIHDDFAAGVIIPWNRNETDPGVKAVFDWLSENTNSIVREIVIRRHPIDSEQFMISWPDNEGEVLTGHLGNENDPISPMARRRLDAVAGQCHPDVEVLDWEFSEETKAVLLGLLPKRKKDQNAFFRECSDDILAEMKPMPDGDLPSSKRFQVDRLPAGAKEGTFGVFVPGDQRVGRFVLVVPGSHIKSEKDRLQYIRKNTDGEAVVTWNSSIKPDSDMDKVFRRFWPNDVIPDEAEVTFKRHADSPRCIMTPGGLVQTPPEITQITAVLENDDLPVSRAATRALQWKFDDYAIEVDVPRSATMKRNAYGMESVFTYLDKSVEYVRITRNSGRGGGYVFNPIDDEGKRLDGQLPRVMPRDQFTQEALRTVRDLLPPDKIFLGTYGASSTFPFFNTADPPKQQQQQQKYDWSLTVRSAGSSDEKIVFKTLQKQQKISPIPETYKLTRIQDSLKNQPGSFNVFVTPGERECLLQGESASATERLHLHSRFDVTNNHFIAWSGRLVVRDRHGRIRRYYGASVFQNKEVPHEMQGRLAYGPDFGNIRPELHTEMPASTREQEERDTEEMQGSEDTGRPKKRGAGSPQRRPRRSQRLLVGNTGGGNDSDITMPDAPPTATTASRTQHRTRADLAMAGLRTAAFEKPVREAGRGSGRDPRG